MAANTFGEIFRVTTFGESHGEAIGAVIDGCPAGLRIDADFIRKEMARRSPGQSAITTQRKEGDAVEILSGVFENVTTGSPIALLIKNKDQRSADYTALSKIYRPSHADYTYEKKYGLRDYRGGGRASARETAARVAAGAIAKLFLNEYHIRITAYVSAVGEIKLDKPYQQLSFSMIDSHPTRCPNPETDKRIQELILQLKAEGDSVGGVVSCVIEGCPAGLGEPVFDKLNAALGNAMLGINAVKGFELGSGFAAATMRGSQHNDSFVREGEKFRTLTNNSGGIQGGISNGEDIYFNVAFKPVATIAKPQETLNTAGEKTTMEAKGRHDPCVVPRAVPIVEAMAALVIADFVLRNRGARV
ncbi:MAG: chorismate synthase [Bacteroidetes bacterium]|nr:chorismate synthase [Bacteroidota bacterium]